MAIRFVTLLIRDDRELRDRRWEDEDVCALSAGLVRLGVHCLLCRDHHYPDVIGLVASDIADKIVSVIPPSLTPYKIVVVDMDSAEEDAQKNMVREICYPVLGPFTRAPAT